MIRSKIMRLEGAAVNQGDSSIVFFLGTSSIQIDKGSYCLIQLGLTNPLEKCKTYFPDTKVASQRCHMELLKQKLTKLTTLGDHNLVQSIRIMVYNKKYPCMVYYAKL